MVTRSDMKRLWIIAALVLALAALIYGCGKQARAATFYTDDSAHTAVPTSSSVTKNGAPWTSGNLAFGTASSAAGKYVTATLSNVTSSGAYGIVANYAGTKETYQVDYDRQLQNTMNRFSSVVLPKARKLPDYWNQ